MVDDRPVEAKANAEANQVNPAKLLEYITKDSQSAANPGAEHKVNGLLPNTILSDHDSSNFSKQLGELKKSSLLESEPAGSSKQAGDQAASCPGHLFDANNSLKVLTAGSAVLLDAHFGPGRQPFSDMVYAGLGVVQGYQDFNHLIHQNSIGGFAKYTAALAADSVIAAGSAGILYYRPFAESYDFAVMRSAVYGAMAARGLIKLAE